MPDANLRPNYWAVIPADVRYDRKLPPNAKLLYAEITSLADAHGYCFASNAYFGECFGVNIKSIQRLLKLLENAAYIKVEVVRGTETKQVVERRIYVGVLPSQKGSDPHLKNKVTSPQKSGDPSPQKCGVEQYNIFNNIPPIVPQGEKRVRRAPQPPKSEPDWEPERFAGLWTFYPSTGRRGKQAAIRAWDKLRPEPELIDTMAQSLVRLKDSDEWKRGIGIPHVSTFLNQRRWEDADELPDPGARPPDDPDGWAPDPEVI